jgi:hypothetical protein
MAKKNTLSDKDLMKLSHLLVQEADSYLDENIKHQRARALRYYLGENPDNMPLVDGRSQMVDTQLRDTIEWIMPDLVRTFAGDDKICSIEPHGDEDNFDADLADEWVNYVIMRQNRGFLITNTWIKDALLSKLGFIKQYWEEDKHRKRIDLEGLTEKEFTALKKAEDFDISDSKKYPVFQVITPKGGDVWVTEDEVGPGMELVEDSDGDVSTQMVWDVTGYQLSSEWLIREENCPPEEIGFLSDTKEIPWQCRLLYHETQKTLGEVRQMFPDAKLDDDAPGWNITESGLYDEETIERYYDTSQTIGLDDSGDQTFIDPSLRKVWLYEIYMKCDRDGDGVPEWVQLFRMGDETLAVDEVDYPKIFAICPILWPHRAVGLSLADLLFDLQDLQTALNRQILDHVYQANNPRTEIDMTGANEDTIDDYLDNRIGGYVRVDRAGTVRPLEYSPLEPWTFNLLEHWEQKRESRTGVSRLNGGMDPNSLNKTATGVVQILNQAARRIEQIARIFAETGFRDRIRGILDLSAEHPEYASEQVMRLSGEAKALDAQAITGRYDLVVNAGVGTGNKEQQAQHMMQLLQTQRELVQNGLGPGSAHDKQMVTLQNIYNVTRDLIVNWGHRNTADYITDPSDEKADRDPVVEQQPSKDELDHQAEMKKLEIEEKKGKTAAHKIDEEIKIKQEELKLEERRIALEEYKVGQEMATAGNAGPNPNGPDPAEIGLKQQEVDNDHATAMRELDLKQQEIDIKRQELEANMEESESMERNEDMAGSLSEMKEELEEKIDEFTKAANRKRQVIRDEDGLIKEIV